MSVGSGGKDPFSLSFDISLLLIGVVAYDV